MSDIENSGIRALQDAEELISAEHRALYDYWLAKKGATAFPTYSSIDILDFPEEAKLWAIVRVMRNEEDGFEFLYQFVGTAIVSLVQMEPTATNFSVLQEDYPDGDFGSDAQEVYREVLKLNNPVLNGPTDMPLPNGETLRFLSLSLPLASDGTEISHVLTAVTVISQN